MSRVEYVVSFGDDMSSRFVRLAMAEAECHSAKLGEKVVRCRDCKHATITINGECKYCEMFWSPDTDGYGADPQLYLPGDFFCAFGEERAVAR